METVRFAIYSRKSVLTDRGESVENQVELCRRCLAAQYPDVGPEEIAVYEDEGFSGRDLQRPQFRRMLEDIRRERPEALVCYRLDRVSRSVGDFADLIRKLEGWGVGFLCIRERFDTSTPMGKAMMYIASVFAQLERETIQKRVADAYFSRSQKSFYMGGRVPYGYRLVPAVIDGVKTSMYEIVPEEAEVVRLMYELYSKPECSYGDLLRTFQEHGITKNGKPWVRTRMADILRSPIYVRADLSVYQFYQNQGAIIANDPSDFIGTNGCYYYKGKEGSGRKQMNLEGNHLVLAPHEGIVPADTWLKCRLKCLNAKQVRPYQKAKNTWLAGKVKCGICGYALVDKHYANSKARYLLCSHRMDTKACPGPGTIYTDDFENLIYDEMKKKMAMFQRLRRRNGPAADLELTARKLELARLEQEIDALLERLAQADDVMYRYISERVGELDGRKRELAKEISERSLRKEVDCQEITGHLTRWEELSFEDKRQTVDQLIKVIYATSDKVQIEWRI